MPRTATVTRKTAETDVTLSVDLDGSGKVDVDTGVGFFDHMLTLLGRHAMIDLDVKAVGDLHVDAHHTVEDVGLVLGQALREALGDKRGIRRYGDARLPMDEVLAAVAIDLSGRPFYRGDLRLPPAAMIGTFPAELVAEFLRALASEGEAGAARRRRGRRQLAPRRRGMLQGARPGLADGGRIRPAAGRRAEHEGDVVRFLRVLLVPLLIAGQVGCSYGSYDKPVRFYPTLDAGNEVREAAPRDGRYVVVTSSPSGGIVRWRDVSVTLRSGDAIGFYDDAGTLVAFARGETFRLGEVAAGVDYVAWATRERRAGTTRNPLAPLGDVALYVGGTLLLIGGVALAIFVVAADGNEFGDP